MLNMHPKVCLDCKKDIPELEAFPGPRCLPCHAKKVDSEPLQRPDFIKAINPKFRKKRGE